MQDKETSSPLDAWSSAGVFTEMEDTGEGAGGKRRRKVKLQEQARRIYRPSRLFLCSHNAAYV